MNPEPETSDDAPRAPSSESVTVCVAWKVRAGKEHEFERWLDGVGHAAARFAGHRGLNVLRPRPGSREFVYIFRFDSYAHLRAWEESREREEWVARS